MKFLFIGSIYMYLFIVEPMVAPRCVLRTPGCRMAALCTTYPRLQDGNNPMRGLASFENLTLTTWLGDLFLLAVHAARRHQFAKSVPHSKGNVAA